MRVVLRVFLRVIIVFILFVVLGLAFLTITEYRPDEQEIIALEKELPELVTLNETYRMMIFNIGYAGLGASEDFVLDGGSKSRPDSRDDVEYYMTGILNTLADYSADFYLLQEVDLSARRSYRINQLEAIQTLLGEAYVSLFALNFNALFVPFPVSLTDYIGGVESGLQTLSNKSVSEATRHQFPGSFAWPVRVVNLKRAMLVSYHDITGSDKQLVVINLHMSAYDADGSLRTQEMAYLKAFMRYEYEENGNYVIVGGDFNQTFPSAESIYPPHIGDYVAYPMDEDFLPEGFTFHYDPNAPTCRLLNQPYNPEDNQTQYYIIDGYIVSANVLVHHVKTHIEHHFKYSDHNPVVLEFELLED